MLTRSIVFMIFAAPVWSACAGGGAGAGSTSFVQATMQPPHVSHFREYALPPSGTAVSSPIGIALGGDGNLWFADSGVDKIGRITPAGHIDEFAPGAHPTGGIVAGNDGNMWFTTGGFFSAPFGVGKITPTGTISLFTIPAAIPYFSKPASITRGPDQNIWFTAEICTQRGPYFCLAHNPIVGRVSADGKITEFMNRNGAQDGGRITSGSDGNLWFTEDHAIGRITTNGSVLSDFQVPMPDGEDALGGITAGPDGALWFARSNLGPSADESIFTLTTGGVLTERPVLQAPVVTSGLMELTAGSDGNMWFTDSAHNEIGSITLAGKISEYPIPTANAGTADGAAITAGPGGTIWFAEPGVGKIGVYTP